MNQTVAERSEPDSSPVGCNATLDGWLADAHTIAGAVPTELDATNEEDREAGDQPPAIQQRRLPPLAECVGCCDGGGMRQRPAGQRPLGSAVHRAERAAEEQDDDRPLTG